MFCQVSQNSPSLPQTSQRIQTFLEWAWTKEGQRPGDSSDMTNRNNSERNAWRGWIKNRRAITFCKLIRKRETQAHLAIQSTISGTPLSQKCRTGTPRRQNELLLTERQVVKLVWNVGLIPTRLAFVDWSSGALTHTVFFPCPSLYDGRMHWGGPLSLYRPSASLY